MASCLIFTIWLIFFSLINSQTLPPSSPPTFNCSSTGRTGCDEHTTLPFNATQSPTPANFTFGHGRDDSVSMVPTESPHITLSPTNAIKPTLAPVINGRHGSNATQVTIVTTQAPTHSPLTHDFDTNFPSKVPSAGPTYDGYTPPPTQETIAPTSTPTYLPTEDPTNNPTGTVSIHLWEMETSLFS